MPPSPAIESTITSRCSRQSCSAMIRILVRPGPFTGHATQATHDPNKHRRRVRDYETGPDHHKAMVPLTMITTMTRRLART
jgi:hypothetical protein